MHSNASASRRTAKQSRPATVFELVLGVSTLVAMMLAILWMDWILGVAMYRNSRAMSTVGGYQKSQGFIVRCKKKKGSSVGQVFIEYTFRDEDGQNYTSDRISHPIAKLNRQQPEYREWQRSFPAGQKVVVYYDPADPEGTAVLRPGLQGFYLLDAMQLTVFHAISMAVLQAILSESRCDHAAVVFFLVLAFLCFLTTCLVGATVNPSLNVMLWAWTFVLAGASFAATVYSRERRNQSVYQKRLADERE